MVARYVARGLLECLGNPTKIFGQPGIILEKLLFGLRRTIRRRVYRHADGCRYLDLYGYRFAVGQSDEFFTDIMTELYPFLKEKVIESIIPEGSYFDPRAGFTLRAGDHVVDAGASLGFFAVPAAVRVGQAGRVYAFEPVARTSELLGLSKLENGLDNLRVFTCGLGERAASAALRAGAGYGTASRIVPDAADATDADAGAKTSIVSIDGLLESGAIERVDFIKMDIEGFERHALRGARRAIREFKPRLSICTYHYPEDPVLLTEIIREARDDYRFRYKAYKLHAD